MEITLDVCINPLTVPLNHLPLHRPPPPLPPHSFSRNHLLHHLISPLLQPINQIFLHLSHTLFPPEPLIPIVLFFPTPGSLSTLQPLPLNHFWNFYILM